MSKADEIAAIVDGVSPGLLDRIAREDGLTKEALVRKILALSRGRMVRTHHNRPRSGSGGCDAVPPVPSAAEEEAWSPPAAAFPGNPAE